MPSIANIFGGDAETESTDFDLDKFLSEADSIIASKSQEQGSEEPAPEAVQAPAEGAPSPPEEPGGSSSSGGGGEGESGAEMPPPASVSSPAPDPLSEIPADRRAQLLALDEYMREHPEALARITAPEVREVPVPLPTLPEHIDPGSVEAELWTEQQTQRRLLEEIRQGQVDTQQSLATERLRVTTQEAAMSAGNAFAARYEGKLTRDDVLAIAQVAGQGIAGRLAAQAKTPEEITAAYDEALEHVLWKTPEFREKAIGPIVGVPDVPTQKDRDKAAAPERKRKLTALSGAASPVAGAPSGRSPLETRPDGRFTGQSRMELVKEIGGRLRAAGSEGN